VGNHSGGKVPIDLFIVRRRWYSHFAFERPLRALMHDVLFRPSKRLAKGLRRIGCTPAGKHAAERCFGSGHSVHGVTGRDFETYRPFRESLQGRFRHAHWGSRSRFATACPNYAHGHHW